MRRKGICYPTVRLVELELLSNKSYLATVEVEDGIFFSKKKIIQVFSNTNVDHITQTAWYDSNTGKEIDCTLSFSIRRAAEAQIRLKDFQLAKKLSS